MTGSSFRAHLKTGVIQLHLQANKTSVAQALFLVVAISFILESTKAEKEPLRSKKSLLVLVVHEYVGIKSSNLLLYSNQEKKEDKGTFICYCFLFFLNFLLARFKVIIINPVIKRKPRQES